MQLSLEKPVSGRWAMWLLMLGAIAISSDGGTSGGLVQFNTPIANVVQALTGDTGRLVVVAAAAMYGFYLFQSRTDDKGQKLFALVIGGAFVIGAQTFVDSMGFVGAVY